MRVLNPTILEHINALITEPSCLQEQAKATMDAWAQKPAEPAIILGLLLKLERLAKIHAAGMQHNQPLIHELLNLEPLTWEDTEQLPAPVKSQRKMGETLFNSVNQPNPMAPNTFLGLRTTTKGRYMAEEIVEQALNHNVAIDLEFTDPAFQRILINALSPVQADHFRNFLIKRYEPITYQINISDNALPELPARNPVSSYLIDGYDNDIKRRRRIDEVRWVLTYIPTEEEAQIDGIDYPDYLTFFFEAADQPWQHIRTAQAKLIAAFNKGDDLHITNSDGTNIRMKLTGHTFANSVIQRNIPGSEIFSGPVRESVNGTVVANGTFAFDIHGETHVMKNLRLTFENGLVTNAEAEEGQEALTAIISQDDHRAETDPKYQGMRKVGEIGIGTNPHIRQHLANPLLVEKISGSFHIALGSAYGNRYMGEDVFMDNGNRASAHWDITTMLRGKEGRMYLDGHLMQKDGVWQAVPELGITAEDVRVLNEGWRALPNAQQPHYWRNKFISAQTIAS